MKGGYWVSTEIDDIKNINYSFEAHVAVKLKNAPWLYCKHCGLIFLKNNSTRWCIKMGCNYSYHINYKL